MIKNLIVFALAISFSLMSPIAKASTGISCPGSVSEVQFFKNLAGSGYTVYTLDVKATKTIVESINRNRSRNNVATLDPDVKLYFANIGVNTTGIMFGLNGCVVAGSAIQLPSTAVAELFLLAGVKDKDYIKVMEL